MAETFHQLDDLKQADVLDFTVLLSELSRGFAAKHLDEKVDAVETNLKRVLDEMPSAFVMVNRDPITKRIVATATGNIVLGHSEGWVDDVVTLESHRGKGLGLEAMYSLHDKFRDENIWKARLTSAPLRASAGNLYAGMGYIEGGEVWRAPLSNDNTPDIDYELNFNPINCVIPTGNKAWVYGPEILQPVEKMAEGLRASKALLHVQQITSANYFTTEPTPELTEALALAGFAQRETRLYTIDLESVC